MVRASPLFASFNTIDLKQRAQPPTLSSARSSQGSGARTTPATSSRTPTCRSRQPHRMLCLRWRRVLDPSLSSTSRCVCYCRFTYANINMLIIRIHNKQPQVEDLAPTALPADMPLSCCDEVNLGSYVADMYPTIGDVAAAAGVVVAHSLNSLPTYIVKPAALLELLGAGPKTSLAEFASKLNLTGVMTGVDVVETGSTTSDVVEVFEGDDEAAEANLPYGKMMELALGKKVYHEELVVRLKPSHLHSIQKSAGLKYPPKNLGLVALRGNKGMRIKEVVCARHCRALGPAYLGKKVSFYLSFLSYLLIAKKPYNPNTHFQTGRRREAPLLWQRRG